MFVFEFRVRWSKRCQHYHLISIHWKLIQNQSRYDPYYDLASIHRKSKFSTQLPLINISRALKSVSNAIWYQHPVFDDTIRLKRIKSKRDAYNKLIFILLMFIAMNFFHCRQCNIIFLQPSSFWMWINDVWNTIYS